jgi:hypothetical protein|tara:strand:- start:221 stop:475 length:255 start_codon:yes stop_codon:yes gene_type:complete
MQDLFISVKDRLKEYTNIIHIDYERESILLEVQKDYLDEIMRIIRTDPYIDFDVVFQKELKENKLTIAICLPQIIDMYEGDDTN